MKAGFITNLILLVLVSALCLYAWFNKPTPKTEAALTAVPAQQVDDIRIKRAGFETIHLKKINSNWQLSEPFNAPANGMRIGLILSILSTPQQRAIPVSPDMNLKQFGLTNPKTILTVNGLEIAFGNEENISKHHYVLYAHKIYLINDNNAIRMLSASPGSFINNRLLVGKPKLKKLIIPHKLDDKADGNIEIAMKNGEWQSNAKFNESDKLNGLMDSWRFAYATQVIHLNKEQIDKLSQPQVKIWLQGQQAPINLIASKTQSNLFLINPKTQLKYSFPAAMASQLFPEKD